MTSLSYAVERATLRPLGLAAAILLVLLASVWGRMIHEDHSFDNTYVHQAVAFARGQVTIATKIFDTAEKDGRLFVVFPPGPALLLAPFAALWGTHVRVLLLTPVLGALIAFLAFRLARRVGVTSQTARWAVIGLVFGTSLLLSMRVPIDTYLSHCCAVAALFVALDEAFGRQRGLIIGFALGLAVLSRQLTALTIPFVWAVLWLRPQAGTGRAVRSIAATWVGLLVCAGFYLWLNDARFGNPFDFGYEYLREPTWYGYRAERWGQFNWVYVPSNLIRMLLSGFTIEFDPPSYMVPHMSLWGTSLTFASPWVFFAFRGRLAPTSLQRAAWVSICVTTLAVLAHKSAMGGQQINGLRYTLDFMPVLFVLAALGMQRAEGTPYQRLAHALIVYSVVLNFVAQDGVDTLGQWLQRLPH
jgi:4-amino-4-deoxy-L-arabinose transferase-like glycosyltransferase